MNKLTFAITLVASLFTAQAWAIPITGVNDPTNNRAEFVADEDTIELTNLSNFDARITAFGFDTTTDLYGLASVIGTLDADRWQFTVNQTVGGGGGGTFDVGATTNLNLNLLGGFTNAGIAVNQTGFFTFDTVGGVDLANVTNPFVRFQQTGANGEGSDRGVPTMTVPEPSSVLLLGIGLAAAGFARRRHGRS